MALNRGATGIATRMSYSNVDGLLEVGGEGRQSFGISIVSNGEVFKRVRIAAEGKVPKGQASTVKCNTGGT